MKFGILVAGAVALTGCSAVTGPATLDDAMQDAAGFFNRNGADFLPKEIKSAKVSSTVKGDVITIRLDNMPTGHATYDPDYARKMFRPKICETSRGRNIIKMGGKIRVEMRSQIGKELPPVQIARC